MPPARTSGRTIPSPHLGRKLQAEWGACLAADVGQLATEGDNAVAGVRKRLLQGGHHHNAAEEAKGIYDAGYVVVTRAAKQVFLDASRTIGQQASAPKAEPLQAEWKKIQGTYAEVMKAGG